MSGGERKRKLLRMSFMGLRKGVQERAKAMRSTDRIVSRVNGSLSSACSLSSATPIGPISSKISSGVRPSRKSSIVRSQVGRWFSREDSGEEGEAEPCKLRGSDKIRWP